MHDGLCPHCGRTGRWAFAQFSLSFPPTGGDYEWAETDASATCPHCGAQFDVRIRIDLDDHAVSRIVQSPFPTVTDWHFYVVAEVVRWAEADLKVAVIQFAKTLAEAEAALSERGGGYDGGFRRRTVLKMSAAGYEERNGRPLHESAAGAIYYA